MPKHLIVIHSYVQLCELHVVKHIIKIHVGEYSLFLKKALFIINCLKKMRP